MGKSRDTRHLTPGVTSCSYQRRPLDRCQPHQVQRQKYVVGRRTLLQIERINTVKSQRRKGNRRQQISPPPVCHLLDSCQQLRATESDLRPLNIGPSNAWKKAASREHWRSIVDTAQEEYAMKRGERRHLLPLYTTTTTGRYVGYVPIKVKVKVAHTRLPSV